MELQLIAIGLLAGALLFGGAIGYITRRDRGPNLPATRHPAEERTAEGRRAAARTPADQQARERTAVERPVIRPEPLAAPPSSLGDPLGASQAVPLMGAGGGEAEVVRQALRANQEAMRDPRLSTLDRVQALMSSPAFTLHLAEHPDEPAVPGVNAERDPRDQREPL